MLGADVCRYRGGNTSAVARDRYGGRKVARSRRKYVNRSKMVESSWTAVFRTNFSLSPSPGGDGTDNDFEKKTREDSSIG